MQTCGCEVQGTALWNIVLVCVSLLSAQLKRVRDLSYFHTVLSVSRDESITRWVLMARKQATLL